MEQKAAHTPGPWSVRPSSNAENGAAWRDIVSDGQAFGPSYVGEALERDAYLIAAAPELLAALETAYMALIGYLPAHRNDVTDAAIGAARAAITKATGEAA